MSDPREAQAESRAPSLVALAPAERHRSVAGRFAALVSGTTSWDSPAPVDGWVAGDVVDHLLEWFPGFLAGGGVELIETPPGDGGRPAAWAVRTAAVQALLDDPATAGAEFAHPMAGTHTLEDAVDRFYTVDVFMHTWDLARALGADDRLDPAFADELRSGMEPMDGLLRSSGQFGPRVPVAADADATDRLVGFIGRDPGWRPPRQP